MKNGRRFGSPPKPYPPPGQPTAKINTPDPDSRTLKTPRGFLQGYRLIGQGVKVLIPPDKRRGTRPGWDGGRSAFMRNVLDNPAAGELYAQRQRMIEPIFADTQVQPPRRPVLTPWQSRGAQPMAPDHRHRQPAEALAAHHPPEPLGHPGAPPPPPRAPSRPPRRPLRPPRPSARNADRRSGAATNRT